MSTPPRFILAHPPTLERPGYAGIAPGAPTCCSCPSLSTIIDTETGMCVECWRVLVALPAVLVARAIRPEYSTSSVVVVDEVAAARVARTVPILTEESASAGVSLKIDIEPPKRRR